jgi:predicted ester cyclase
VHYEAPIAGIPATGKHVSIKGSDVYKIEGKKILEWWEFNDLANRWQQIRKGEVI